MMHIRTLAAPVLLAASLAALAGGCSSSSSAPGDALFVDIPPVAIVDSGNIVLTDGVLGGTADLVLTESGSGASVTLPTGARIASNEQVYDTDGDGDLDYFVVTIRPISVYAASSGSAVRNGAAVDSASFNKVGGIALLPMDATFSEDIAVTVPVSTAAESASLDIFRWNPDGARVSSAAAESNQGRWEFVTSATKGTGDVTFNATQFGQYAVVSQQVTGGTGGGNATPTVSLAATPTSGAPPLSVDFTATAADTDGTIAKYEFDFEGTGTFTDNGTASTASHDYATAGTFAAAVRVTDDQGATATATQTITVGTNQLPVVSTLTAAPASPHVDEDVTLTATATDTDGTIANYAWDFQNDGTLDSPTNTTNTLTLQYTFEGAVTARVVVTDNAGGTAEKTLDLTIQPAVGGTTVDLAVDTATGAAPLAVNFTSTPTPASGATISKTEYDLEGTGVFVEDTDAPDTATHTYAAGRYNATVRVTDSNAVTATDSVEIVATGTGGNQPPTAGLSASPTSGDAALAVSFDASTSADADGTIANYSFDFDSDGTIDFDAGTTPTTTHNYATAGTFIARVRVTDNGGAVAYAAQTITVTTPSAVLTADLQASQLSGAAPLTVNFDASGSTPPNGGSIVKYEFDFGEGGGFQDLGTTATTSHVYNTAGTFNAQLRVTDDTTPTALQDTAQVSIEVTGGGASGFKIFGRTIQWDAPQPGGATHAINGLHIELHDASDNSLIDTQVSALGGTPASDGYFEFTDVPADDGTGGGYYLLIIDPVPSADPDGWINGGVSGGGGGGNDRFNVPFLTADRPVPGFADNNNFN